MKILFAASEATPFVKTGGLADVAGALPAALQQQGVDVTLALPAYPGSRELLQSVSEFARLQMVGVGTPVAIHQGRHPVHDFNVLLVEADTLFDRPGNPYKDATGADYSDNALRYVTFCRALAAVALGQANARWRPDLVHCSDWQTGLLPAFLIADPARPATVFTIHNLAYQGLFPAETFAELHLPERLWSHEALEFHGNLSLIKGGIVFADVVTTVSPTYAREIREPELGFGLDGLLRFRGNRLFGILNGIDTETWDPHRDPLIPVRYDAGTLERKQDNKRVLQARLGLPENPDAMLIGHIGRLVPQKGVDLIIGALPTLLREPELQFAVLGSGDANLERALRDSHRANPRQFGVHIGYDETLAHLLEAGADCFLMPSRFEPCGLNQMYSLRYGTLPIVHRTGGLADTVVDADHQSMLNGSANGFLFEAPTASDLADAVLRALALRRRPPIWWQKVARAGMREDFSWQKGASDYIELYHFALDNPTHPAQAIV